MTTPMSATALDQLVDRLVEQINQGCSFADIVRCVYEQLQGIIPCNRLAVALVVDPAHLLRLVACQTDGPEALKIGYEDPIAGSTLETLLRTGQPRILNDLPAYLEGKPDSRSTRLIVREGMQSNLTLPLIANGRPIGVLFFSSRQKHTYTEEHAHLVRRLAAHLAISLEKAQLIADLRERNQELEGANALQETFLQQLQDEVQRQTVDLRRSEQRYRLLVNLAQVVNSTLDLREVFRRVGREIHGLFGCDRVSLILAEAGEWRQGFALEGPEADRWVEIERQPLSDSAAGWVLHHRRARIVRDLTQARPFPEDRRLHQLGYHGYLYQPLLCRGSPSGVLGLAARSAGGVERWDLTLLQELSALLATALDNTRAYSELEALREHLERENTYLRAEIGTSQESDLLGGSSAMGRVRQDIRQVAPTDSTVLILGETGTGKELVARLVHEQSTRHQQLLVKVNCAALAPALITSELFGHEAGAFTGASKRRIGRFELANHGTLFLDEIAELCPETQVLLLRVLQERVIERVGGNEPIPVDVRLLAATNRDLRQLVAEGGFRADLFYRLNVFPIALPPLRERPEDIPTLVEHFLAHFARRMNRALRRIDSRTLDLLCGYGWPGNVRELEHIIERAAIISTGSTLEVEPSWLASPPPTAAPASPGPLASLERQTILEALRQAGGKIYGPGGAAEALGLKPTTLYGKMRKHRIRKSSGPTLYE